MPRWAVCRCGEGGTVTVQGAGDRSRTFAAGSRVDLDAVIVPATGQTMAEALEKYLHLFEEEDKPANPFELDKE